MNKTSNTEERTDSQVDGGPGSSVPRRWDALLIVGLLCLGYGLWIYGQTMWVETDRKFFLLLPLVTLGLIVFNAKPGLCTEQRRSLFSMAALVLGAISAGMAIWLQSIWFFPLSATLLLLAWALARLVGNPWYQIVGWLAPLGVLLLFPLTAENPITEWYETQVVISSSGLLDLMGIANLPVEGGISSEFLTISSKQICRGIGSPFLLVVMAVLALMFLPFKPLISALTLVFAPLWAWAAAVAHITIRIALSTQWQQAVVEYEILSEAGQTLLALLLLLGLAYGISVLLKPFAHYATGSNAVHKFYNKCIYWPAKDPLRSKKEKSKKDDQRDFTNGWNHRATIATQALSAVGLLIGGILSITHMN